MGHHAKDQTRGVAHPGYGMHRTVGIGRVIVRRVTESNAVPGTQLVEHGGAGRVSALAVSHGAADRLLQAPRPNAELRRRLQ